MLKCVLAISRIRKFIFPGVLSHHLVQLFFPHLPSNISHRQLVFVEGTHSIIKESSNVSFTFSSNNHDKFSTIDNTIPSTIATSHTPALPFKIIPLSLLFQVSGKYIWWNTWYSSGYNNQIWVNLIGRRITLIWSINKVKLSQSPSHHQSVRIKQLLQAAHEKSLRGSR